MFREMFEDGARKRKDRAQRKFTKKRGKNPNAGKLEQQIGKSKHFGGIFRDIQLQNIIILKYPVALLVIVKRHWLVLYIDRQAIEIYDSLMNICRYENVLRFLRNNLTNKICKMFPKIQSSDNGDCALFAIFFVQAKSRGKKFESLLKMFRCNFKYNAFKYKLVRTGFNTRY